MTLRVGVASHLVEDRALHVENAPVRSVRCMRVFERDQRLLVLPNIGKRTAVRTEQRHAVGISDGSLFKHGNGLGALVGRTQRARIGNGSIRIARIVPVVGGHGIQGFPRIRLRACHRARLANGARDVAAADIGAPARGQAQNGCDGG